MPLDDDRMPTLQEKYKVAHFDAKAVGNEEFTAAGVPTTFLLHLVLLGELHLLRARPGAGRGRRARRHLPDGRQEAPEHRGRGHRQVRLRALQGRRPSTSARPSASRAGIRPAPRSPRRSRRRSARRCATTTCRPTCSGASASRAPTTSGTCSSSSATSTSSYAGESQHRVLALAQSGAADARRVARGEHQPRADRLAAATRPVSSRPTICELLERKRSNSSGPW